MIRQIPCKKKQDWNMQSRAKTLIANIVIVDGGGKKNFFFKSYTFQI